MHAALRVLLWSVVVLAALVLLAAAALRWMNWNMLKDEVEAQLSQRLGQDVAIGGDLDVQVGMDTIRVQAHDVRVEDTLPDTQPLLTLEEVRIGVDTGSLLAGNPAFDHIVLVAPQLTLIRTADGEVNWDFEDMQREEAAALPVVEHFEVKGGGMVYRDAALEQPVRLSLDRIEGQVTPAGILKATASAEIESRELQVDLRANRIDDGADWRVDASARLADATLSVAGTVAEPDVEVTLHVSDPQQLDFLPIPDLPQTEAIRLNTRLTRDQGQWWLDDLQLALGEQRLNGDVRIEADQEPPMIYATLYLNRLELPETEATVRKEVIPPTPVDTAPLHRVNLRADLHIGDVANTPVPVGDVKLLVELYHGRLVARPISAEISRGRVEGSIVFDASEPVAAATVRLSLRDIDLAPAVPGEDNPITGEIGGRIDLRTRGDNLEELAGNVDGQLLFVMREGAVKAAWVEALDLDIAEWLVVSGTTKTAIRCALIAFAAEDGVLRPRPAVVDTRDSIITLDGFINLPAETMSLTVRSFPKDASVLSASGPIRVTGWLGDPSVEVLTGQVLGKGAAALALGALAGPLAGLIPLLEPGLAGDTNCRRLLADLPPKKPPAGNGGAQQ